MDFLAYYFYGYDWTILLLIPAILFAAIAQARVQSTFKKYSAVLNRRGMTGAECAQMILHRFGISDVRVERVSGHLSDHYDPRNKVLRLSDSVYGSTSVAAIGVAAHECGHAVQHQQGYLPIKIRSAIVPVTNIGSTLSWPILLIGLLFGFPQVALFGAALFGFCVLFQLVTLPVEFNASNRALAILEESGTLDGEELAMSKAVLSAAAMTYVAALVSALAQFLRLLLIANRGRRDR